MYDYTIEKIKEYNFIDKKNEEYKYLLWMCNEITNMKDILKAARWIGYVLRMVEKLNFWNNNISRDYIREDVRVGNDVKIKS